MGSRMVIAPDLNGYLGGVIGDAGHRAALTTCRRQGRRL
jgi:hypothetical protein